MHFTGYRGQQWHFWTPSNAWLLIIELLKVSWKCLKSVTWPPNFGISVVHYLILGTEELLFSCSALGICDYAELTSAHLLSAIILSFLAPQLTVSFCKIFLFQLIHHHHHSSCSCTAFILPMLFLVIVAQHLHYAHLHFLASCQSTT